MCNWTGNFARSNAGQPPLIRGLFYVANQQRYEVVLVVTKVVLVVATFGVTPAGIPIRYCTVCSRVV